MLPKTDAPQATLINNWIDINTRKRWINFTIQLDFILQNNDYLSTTTTILASRFHHLKYKGTFEQRPLVNNCHNLGSRVWSLHSGLTVPPKLHSDEVLTSQNSIFVSLLTCFCRIYLFKWQNIASKIVPV
jgi:hypothetical protein